MEFPFGRAPFFILLAALGSGAGVLITHSRYRAERPDLVVATHARLHADIYRARIPEFEQRHGVRVNVLQVERRALRQRLLAAFSAGSDVPDIVEIQDNASYFLRGPLEHTGLMDLTPWVRERALDRRMVENRFSMWQRDGTIIALPHDVHPVMLAYRADIVEDELGIDISRIETWDDFVTIMRPHVRDLNGDGTIDRYALELPPAGSDTLLMLTLQRDVGLFDEAGRVTLDHEETAQTIEWYLRQIHGPGRIAYGMGYGQALWQGMNDGLVLFYFCADWRVRLIEQYAPELAGKMKLMPLPAWTRGGRRTTTWSATGGAITKKTRNPELARQLLEFLYVDQSDGGRTAFDLRILPPARETWDLPVFDTPIDFFRDQPVMRLFADLAPDVPANYASPYTLTAQAKRDDAFFNCLAYYRANGENGLSQFVRAELRRQADAVRAVIARNIITNQ